MDTIASAILKVVRGEAHWTELRRLGVEVDMSMSGCKVEHVKAGVVARATQLDVARGLLRAYESGPEHLREWACVVLACTFVDLDLDNSPQGDLLLNAIWDASAGILPTDGTLLQAESLAQDR